MSRLYPLSELWFSTTDRPSFIHSPLILGRYLSDPETCGKVIKRSESKTSVIDLARSYQEIRSAYNSRTKRGVNKFARMDLELRSDGLTHDEIYQEIRRFVLLKGYSSPPRSRVFRARWPQLLYNYVFDPVMEVIAGLNVYYQKHGTARLLYSTNNAAYGDRTADASRALHDDFIKRSCGVLKRYDMGGIVLDKSDSRHGITEFKQGFGGEVETTYSFVSINL